MNKWTYGLLCMLPVLLIAGAFGLLVTVLQDHREADCLRYVSSHVVTDQATWKRLVCHA